VTVVLVKGGDDTALVAQAVQRTVAELVGDGDRGLMVEEVVDAAYRTGDGEPELTALVNAAHTPPFLTERRVVVGRHLGSFSRKDQVAPLVAYLADPLPTTDLVLVWEKAPDAKGAKLTVPKTLQEAVTARGGRILDAVPSGRGLATLLGEKLAGAPVRLDAAARALVADTLGEEVGRLDSVLAALESTYGAGSRLGVEEVAPFVGSASDVKPWDLTDAIDAGDIGVALDRLHRMLHGGERHPLAVLATLHRHVEQALALDGAGARTDTEAAAVLGLSGSTFPAKKALQRTRRLGPERLAEATRLLAQADLDLRGASGLDPDATIEVLVARLARLSR
jgi:DNA polymerase III subunit delta